MTKKEIIEKIGDGNCSMDKVLGWVRCLPSNEKGSYVVPPPDVQVGDVFMHPIFTHPYVILRNSGEQWVCVMLTSNAECKEILEICSSRLFHTSYFTKTLITVQEPMGIFIGIFNNPKQLKSVYKTLKKIL